MAFDQLLNWLLLPSIAGLLWIARSVSRLETLMEQSIRDRVGMLKQIDDHTKEISDVKQSVARIEGHLEK